MLMDTQIKVDAHIGVKKNRTAIDVLQRIEHVETDVPSYEKVEF